MSDSQSTPQEPNTPTLPQIMLPPVMPQTPYDTQALVGNIVSGMSNTKLTISNIPLIVPIIMSKVELIKQLAGVQKQQIVLGVLYQLVMLLPPVEQAAVRLLIQQIGPSLISTIIDSANGVFNYGKKEVGVIKARCFPCCS